MTLVKGWVDVHAHFTPPVTEEQRLKQWQGMRSQQFLAPQPYDWSPESALEHMDRTGIAMQLLSNTHAFSLPALRDSNDYGAKIVAGHPTRFGLLAALPTDDPEAALTEIERARSDLHADGYAVSARYNGVFLGDERLEPVWAELNRRQAAVFIHPNTIAPPQLGLPAVLMDVAFETARSVVDMLYAGVLRRYPDLTVILAHAGGALPGLSGRLEQLGAEPWVPNAQNITRDEIREHLGRLYLDTANAGDDAPLASALAMVPRDHVVYGSDSGAPCNTDETLAANIRALRDSRVLLEGETDQLGHRGWDLFPTAGRRAGRS
ncbi:amidohydrolase family protein [Streptomyces sp. NPDC006739]|uniref:amidohydrolase family protein n=1 Tax=Streptomyces sp. NPDC006739 TaxID=3364763 RepID=UPI0036CF9EAC